MKVKNSNGPFTVPCGTPNITSAQEDVTPTIITIDALAKSLAKGEQVDVILLDFSKAFDKVPHHRLLHKLDYYGVRRNTVSMFQRSKWSITADNYVLCTI
jgi:hypothetical protein